MREIQEEVIFLPNIICVMSLTHDVCVFVDCILGQ